MSPSFKGGSCCNCCLLFLVLYCTIYSTILHQLSGHLIGIDQSLPNFQIATKDQDRFCNLQCKFCIVKYEMGNILDCPCPYYHYGLNTLYLVKSKAVCCKTRRGADDPKKLPPSASRGGNQTDRPA